MPNVAEIAREWYEKHESHGALSEALLACFFRGVIVKRDGFLLLAEPCFVVQEQTNKEPAVFLNGFNGANGWFLHFWCSEQGMSSYELCLEAPYPLSWVAYKRRGKIKAVPWETLYLKDFYLGKQPVKEPHYAVPC